MVKKIVSERRYYQKCFIYFYLYYFQDFLKTSIVGIVFPHIPIFLSKQYLSICLHKRMWMLILAVASQALAWKNWAPEYPQFLWISS